MSRENRFTIGGAAGRGVVQLGRMGNRHGMIAGATGSGKAAGRVLLPYGGAGLCCRHQG
jgi:hypothetical protein